MTLDDIRYKETDVTITNISHSLAHFVAENRNSVMIFTL